MKKLLLNWWWLGLLLTLNLWAATGDVSLEPTTRTIFYNTYFDLKLQVVSDLRAVGAYGVKVQFDPELLQVDTTYQNAAGTCYQNAAGESGICPGDNALGATMYNLNNATGTLDIGGFDALGVGPGTLQLVTIHFVPQGIFGTTTVNLVVRDLTSEGGVTAGAATPRDGIGSTITITLGTCGDADGTGIVNIVDALAIARKLVGLPPPPSTNTILADVDGSGSVSVNDMLHIIRYCIGLVTPPEVCAIGQPL